MIKYQEYKCFRMNGFLFLALDIAIVATGAALLVRAMFHENPAMLIPVAVAIPLGVLLMPGFFTVQPNQARVLVFFGKYTGSTRDEGFWWANPFATKRKISLRVRNFSSEHIKVNDAVGNPIEIGAVVVWRVTDSAKATFDVDSYQEFVDVQAETAVRALATRYPYDAADEEAVSLRGNPDLLAEELRSEVQKRLDVAGVNIMEVRLTHLAYAPEIAHAMLRRQQAQAIIAARRLIVDAAVGMVEHALRELSEQNIVQLDEERKAAMVNNMMVVLTSEQGASPVINAGTLYT